MIKAIKLMVGLLSCGFIAVACADSATVLQQRLAKVDSFTARFTQQVTSASGKIVQQGKGELWLKRPNLFNWHMQQPDENSLISDGKTLWFYNPFIEQATATWLKQATSDTPFILISRNSSQDWQQYHVKQQADHFVLTPKKANNQLKQFTIDVNAQGVIHSFVALSQDDQRSAYQLFNQKNGAVPADKFVFRLPKGATLDDQRQ